MSGPVPAASPRNPWMIGLTVLWVLLLLVSLVLLMAGASAADLPEGAGSGPTIAGGVFAALSVVVVAVQLGVGAVRWYLDPSSRPADPAASGRPRPARQDF